MSSAPPSGWTEWTVTRLRDELKALGRPVYGTKSTLQERYLDAIAAQYTPGRRQQQPYARGKGPRFPNHHPEDPTVSSAPAGGNPLLSAGAPVAHNDSLGPSYEPHAQSRTVGGSLGGPARRRPRPIASRPLSTGQTEDEAHKSLLEAQREAAIASRRVDDIKSLEILYRLDRSLEGDDQMTADRHKRIQEIIDELLNNL